MNNIPELENIVRCLRKVDSLAGDTKSYSDSIRLRNQNQLLKNRTEQIIVRSLERVEIEIRRIEYSKTFASGNKKSRLRRKLRQLYKKRLSCKQLLPIR